MSKYFFLSLVQIKHSLNIDWYKMQHITDPRKFYRMLFYTQRLAQGYRSAKHFTTAIDATDFYPIEIFQRQKQNYKHNYCLRYFMGNDNNAIHIESMLIEGIETVLLDLISKEKDIQITKIVKNCLDKRKLVSDDLLKKLFRHFSLSGKVDAVEDLRLYCLILNPNLYKRNGEFLHYVAKAQCMKGNSEKGLSILKEAYTKYSGLRGLYRVVFKELIHDTVQNRSEASVVILRKYVIDFSENYNDQYPLICFWHICWSSTWFSDQMLAENLLDSSKVLQDIIKDKATIFCINILRDYNEDAVIRLLQNLLKYEMKAEYGKVLQILFAYKLKNRDLRGCTEILRNSDTLGIGLSPNQQGQYIKLLIKTSSEKQDEKKKTSKNFKLKF